MPLIQAKRVVVAAVKSNTCRIWQTNNVDLQAPNDFHEVRSGMDRIAAASGLVTLRFAAEPVQRTIAKTDAEMLALAVLMGDTIAAKILADKVLLGE